MYLKDYKNWYEAMTHLKLWRGNLFKHFRRRGNKTIHHIKWSNKWNYKNRKILLFVFFPFETRTNYLLFYHLKSFTSFQFAFHKSYMKWEKMMKQRNLNQLRVIPVSTEKPLNCSKGLIFDEKINLFKSSFRLGWYAYYQSQLEIL